MGDKINKARRSRNMAQIKSKNTKPELILRRLLHKHGYRYNLHGNYRHRKLPGSPDIILPKYHTVIFVNGCFWHGHSNCKYFKFPKTNTDFWKWKITRNRAKDIIHKVDLNLMGWHVITVWECQLKKDKLQNSFKVIQQMLSYIEKNH